MISVELKVVAGKHAGQTIPLDRKKFLIGREQDCQLRPNSELVSRHHCVFTVDDYSVRIRDLGSTNGTSVNGETIRKEVVLKQGDLVTVGSLEFQVTVNEVASEPQTTDIAAAADDTIVAGTETLSEMTPITEPTPTAPTQETTPAAPEPAAAATPAPTQPQPPLETPDAHTGDTTVIAMPAILPGQTPYQPMMPQQMGYPMYGNQQYPGMPMQQPYPGQQFPGQPYPPQPYPQQQMPMQQPYPPQPMPMQQPAPAAVETAQQPVAAPPTEEAATGLPEIALPDPATTGAKAPPPKPPEPEQTAGEETEKPEQSNQSADAIIKQYMQKKPGG